MAALRAKISQAPPTDFYLGRWALVAGESQFPVGRQWAHGTLLIEVDESVGLVFTIEGTREDGGPARIVYSGIPDGRDHPSTHPAIHGAIRTTRVDARRLYTQVIVDGQVVTTVRREASREGETLTVDASDVAGGTVHAVLRRQRDRN